MVVAVGGSSILQHWEQWGSERPPPGSAPLSDVGLYALSQIYLWELH